MSFDLVDSIDAKAFMKALKLIKPSMSLAGIESTVLLPAVASHALLTPEERQSQGIGDNLIRFSVGLESRRDLEADIEQAIVAVSEGALK